jgi:hypothetical protein
MLSEQLAMRATNGRNDSCGAPESAITNAGGRLMKISFKRRGSHYFDDDERIRDGV